MFLQQQQTLATISAFLQQQFPLSGIWLSLSLSLSLSLFLSLSLSLSLAIVYSESRSAAISQRITCTDH
jgi:hypothetical protein